MFMSKKFKKVIEFDLQRFADISNSNSDSLVTGTSENDSITNDADNVTINSGDGADTVFNDLYGSNTSINCGDGNDSVLNLSSNVTIIGGNGKDFIDIHNGQNIFVSGGNDNDSIENAGYKTTISGDDGDDYIYNYYQKVSISGGKGNDTIDSDFYSGYVYNDNKITINAGIDNDLISLNTDEYEHLIEYSAGDGHDIIYGFKANSTLSITGGAYSTTKSGDDLIVTVGDGKISLIGSANYSANIEAENKLTISGTTAKLIADNKTLCTVKGVKSVEGLSVDVDNKVVKVSKSALNEKKITISNGYTLTLADDVPKALTTKTWSVKDKVATLTQKIRKGYMLSANKKSISHSVGETNTLVTVSGVKSKSGLKLSNKTVTVSKSALNGEDITISDSYKLKLDKNIPKPANKKAAWVKKGNVATYKGAYSTAGYKLIDNGKKISYSAGTEAEDLAVVKGVKSQTGLSVSGNVIRLKNSALNRKVTISGSSEFDFASDYKNATITGSSSGDTITARGSNISINGGDGDDIVKMLGKNITVTGGAGDDIFVYKSGKEVITDYAAGDKISIESGNVSDFAAEGKNVILTVGKGKITVENGADKDITCIETYKASGNVAWFLEDDNNFSTDNQLDDLIESKSYSPTAKLDTSTTLTKENNFITYSSKK